MLWELLKQIWWLIPLFLIISFLKSPTFKGWFGEKMVEKAANRKLPQDSYHDFQKVT